MNDLKQLADRYAAAVEKRSGDERMLAKVKARFFEQLNAKQAPRRSWRIAVPIAALAGAAIAVVAILSVPRAPLHATLRGHGDEPADFVLATREAQALDFSDGSEVLVRPDSQLRLLEVTPDGASATLERGSAHVAVVHRAKTKWTFTAGPYRVHVVGTKFELQWNPDVSGIRVKMEEGVVEVDGPNMVRHRVAGTEVLDVSALPPQDTEVDVEPETTTGAPRARTHHAKPAPEKPVVAANSTAPWTYFASRGDYAAAYAAAEQSGFTSLAGGLPQSEVLLLGDTARKANKPQRAKEAYLAVRDRFPGSPAAVDAALRMGHLSAEVLRDDARAAWWFERGLREAPNAPTAPEAMGRWLEVLVRMSNPTARKVAEDYLRRFPNGADAAFARDVMR
jgi:hypothetical protein